MAFAWQGFWGKVDTESGEWLPLIDHSADVAACTVAILERTLLGRRLARIADLETGFLIDPILPGGGTRDQSTGSLRQSSFGRALLILAVLLTPAALHAQLPVEAELRLRVERLDREGELRIASERIASSSALHDLYTESRFQPVWRNFLAAGALRQAILDIESDGLRPTDYHVVGLERLAAAPPTPATLADLDLLRSDALLRVSRDLQYGRVETESSRIAHKLDRSIGGIPAAEALRRIAADPNLEAAIHAMRPAHFIYGGLRTALAAYRRIDAQGGWESLPSGGVLRIGDVDPRVEILRRRLAATGDLPVVSGAEEQLFDGTVASGVRHFQHRHGLNDDGIVGPATRAALNVSVEDRIEQIRINLERARWYARDLPARFVVVNTAGARTYLVSLNTIVWEGRVIVGRTSTRTPLFRGQIEFLELNPSWTVPPGIVDEILLEIRRDPSYLDRMGMRVLDDAGRVVQVSPSTLRRYTAATFPFVFRQDPGLQNPLGRIKFVFPNANNVYMHDTPARELFDYEVRAFSHGCIRVQDPVGLAVQILNDPQWSKASLEAVIATGATRRISLTQPLPVLILYWTASADPDGLTHFYPDVYGQDTALLEALGRSR